MLEAGKVLPNIELRPSPFGWGLFAVKSFFGSLRALACPHPFSGDKCPIRSLADKNDLTQALTFHPEQAPPNGKDAASFTKAPTALRGRR